MRILIIAIAVVIFAVSCAENSSKASTSTVKKDTLENAIENNQNNINDPEAIKYFSDVPHKNFPLVDSTNFDNYYVDSGIENDLFFDEIQFQNRFPEAGNIRLRYLLNYSTRFTSIAISYNKGEHELITTLVNIDHKNAVIDHLVIAYDEIAESALRKISTTTKDQIVVEDWNYRSEETQKSTKTYFVHSDGRFKSN